MRWKIKTTQQPKSKPNGELGFGQFFTDHMLVAQHRTETVPNLQTFEGTPPAWDSAEIIPYAPLSIDPASSVLHYGQALFEGLKAYRRSDNSIWLFRPDFNFKRMQNGAKRLCLQSPSAQLFFEGIQKLVQLDQSWIPASPDSSLYLRPTLFGSEGFLGVRPSREVTFLVLLSPVGSYYSQGNQGIRIWVESEDLRAAPGGIGAAKAGANYAASLRAALRARENGFAQVLWMHADHQAIEEVGTMNVFFVFKNEIVTPELSGSILPGCTRDSILQLLQGKKVPGVHQPIVERRITLQEVWDRSDRGELLEAFGAGTAAVVSPIRELASTNRSVQLSDASKAPVSQAVLKTLRGIQMGDVKDPFEWTVRLEDLHQLAT